MRRLPSIDPTKSDIVDKAMSDDTNDLDLSKVPDDFTIDDLLKKGLLQIYRIMRILDKEILTGTLGRYTVNNLKDCMTMLSELKKKEQEFLDTLTDEELEKLSKK